MVIGNKDFDLFNHSYIMGILNVTPDSFSDGGTYNEIDSALFHTKKMIEEGADIIDVGAESTRPGASLVSAEEEIDRAVPVIERIKAEFDIPVSIDTYKAKTAEACIKAGADMINDIWGLKGDRAMAGLLAKSKLPCCLMHNRNNKDYKDFLEDYLKDIDTMVRAAVDAGIEREKIILDPGIGFAKDTSQNLLALKHLDRMNDFKLPWLLGTSRKSVIGNTLNLPVNDRLEGTLATTALGVINRAGIIRVHDVKENKRIVMMLEAINGCN